MQYLVLKVDRKFFTVPVIRGDLHPDECSDTDERELLIHVLKMHLSDLKEKEKHKTYGAVTELTAHNYLEEVSEAGASSRVHTLTP